MRSAHRTKSKQGYAIGPPPYGYKRDPIDPRKWVVDDEAAEIVKRIYAMRVDRESVNDIALKLKRDKVLIPSRYAQQKGYKNPSKKAVRGEFLWDKSTVSKILTHQVYVGDVVNFCTYSKSYKLKCRFPNPKENWDVLKDVREAIIKRSVWESIQKTFNSTKCRKPKHVEKNMFAGFLKCSDCGANLNYKYTHDNPDNHYFSCLNKRNNSGLCGTTHHIRVDTLTELVTRHISEIVRFASLFEDEFVKLVMDEHYKNILIKSRKLIFYMKGYSRKKSLET